MAANRLVHPNWKWFLRTPLVFLLYGSAMGIGFGITQEDRGDLYTGVVLGVVSVVVYVWVSPRNWVEIRGADTLVVKSPFRRSASVEIDGSLELIVPQRFFGRTECPYVVADGKVVRLTPLSPRYDFGPNRNRVCSEFLDELDALIHSE